MTISNKAILKTAFAALLVLAPLPVAAQSAAQIRLSDLKLKIDPAQTTVSGISSGAYMAGQFQVAYSGLVKAAGLVAGGPYDCAEVSTGGVATAIVALKRCMDVAMGASDVDALVANAKAREKAKEIDPLSNMAQAKIYLFNGDGDVTVKRPVADATDRFYRALGVAEANLSYVKLPKAAHAYITDGYGAACDFIPKEGEKSEYINNCQYDQAGAIVRFFYADAKTPNASAAARQPQLFNQAPFVGDTSRSGMAKTGYIYVPEACEGGAQTCRIHVAFHGCQMASNLIGDHFAVNAGYNRWADVNNIVVLYPQIDGAAKPTSNPKACWDWFGYTGYDFARKSGFQMTAVRKMIGALAGE
ncbi:plasmid partitioning protein [Azospirillum palustre]|uniref:Plasmid partitioning protein n=1 Tax=Azospirillum palustre TaxID=2044885 RepID=A0A2B8BFC1_9PROT|nr:PHB depolymerase family esterase [Azospirillum palustre]PGH56082.1 plasmid partitioning protein [Azospirillum palustre]